MASIELNLAIKPLTADRLRHALDEEKRIIVAGPNTHHQAPVFFLSHARTSSEDASDNAVAQLFADLSKHLAQLFNSLPGQRLGFLDLSMEGSELWERRLLSAAGTCQVFVALLSNRYIAGSRWCAMEWDLFSRRPVSARSAAHRAEDTAILPVLWAPITEPIPTIVNAVQRFSPQGLRRKYFAGTYETDGIYGLLSHDHEVYDSIVWRLAVRIQAMCAAQHVATWIPDDTQGLRTTFGEVRR